MGGSPISNRLVSSSLGYSNSPATSIYYDYPKKHGNYCSINTAPLAPSVAAYVWSGAMFTALPEHVLLHSPIGQASGVPVKTSGWGIATLGSAAPGRYQNGKAHELRECSPVKMNSTLNFRTQPKKTIRQCQCFSLLLPVQLPIDDRAIVGIELCPVGARFSHLGFEFVFVNSDPQTWIGRDGTMAFSDSR